MKKVFLTLLVIVLLVAGLGAAGFAGYRYGFVQGVQSTSDGNAQIIPPSFSFDRNRMPMHSYGFNRAFGPGHGFEMMPGGRMGFGFFGPLLFLVRIAFWALVIWAVYMLATRSGWRLTRTTQPVETQPASTETEAKE